MISQVQVENIKDLTDYVLAVLEKVKPEYMASVYGLSDWSDATDFLAKMALKNRSLSYITTFSYTMKEAK